VPFNLLTISDYNFHKKYDVSEIDDAIRIAFWEQYQASTSGEGPPRGMNISYVYSQVMTREGFYGGFLKDQYRVAYMLRPPVEYTYRLKGMLDLGLRRFHQILKLPLTRHKTFYNKAGEIVQHEEVDTALVANIIRIVALLDNRVKGSVAQKLLIEQKIEGKTLNMHLNSNIIEQSGYEVPKTVREVDKQLKEINDALNEAEDFGTKNEFLSDLRKHREPME
jgi:hypothetical protein